MPTALLTLLICAAGADGDCRWVQPPQDPAPLFACVALSQASAARCAASHPNWSVRGVRCTGLRSATP